MKKISKATETSLEEIIDISGLSKTFIQDRVKGGCFKPVRHGVYRLGDTVRGLIAFYKDQKPRDRSAAAERLLLARAKEVELRTSIKRGEFMPTAEVNENFDMVMGPLIVRLDSLPAQLYPRDLEQRRHAQEIVDRMRRDLAAEWQRLHDEALAEVMGTKTPPPETQEDDA